MFDYNILKENSTEKFKEACDRIESQFPNADKRNLLVDVDGTTIQTYTYNGKKINVFDDYDVGAVFVVSEIDLTELFN